MTFKHFLNRVNKHNYSSSLADTALNLTVKSRSTTNIIKGALGNLGNKEDSSSDLPQIDRDRQLSLMTPKIESVKNTLEIHQANLLIEKEDAIMLQSDIREQIQQLITKNKMNITITHDNIMESHDLNLSESDASQYNFLITLYHFAEMQINSIQDILYRIHYELLRLNNQSQHFNSYLNFQNNKHILKQTFKRLTTVIRNAINLTDIWNSVSNLKTTKLDQENLEKILIWFCEQSFESFGFKLTDIMWFVNPSNKDIALINDELYDIHKSSNKVYDKFTQLLTYGCGFIPSVVYLSLPDTEANNITWAYRTQTAPILTPEQCATLTFFCFFFIITQARWPDTKTEGGSIARTQILTGGLTIEHLMTYLSCSTVKLTQKWIKLVDLKNMPVEFKNRLALGTAGYRLINAVAVVKMKEPTPDEVKNLQAECKKIMLGIPDMHVHPNFRPQNLIIKYGSINKNLNAVLAQYADEESLKALKKEKLIFDVPSGGFIDKKIFELDHTDFTSNKFPNFNNI